MCYSPITLKNGCQVPCGKCMDCLARHRSEWRQRMFFESKNNNRMFFVTLTLSPENMDYFTFNEKKYMTVSKRKIQTFHKRLRRYISYHNYVISFRYFVVSEYGPKTFRPHYHGLYFVTGKDWKFFKDIIKKVWNFGFSDVHLCRNKGKSCSYVSNYLIISKISPYTSLYESSNFGKFNNFDTTRTFVLCSRSLGNDYFVKSLKTQIKQNFLIFAKQTNIISIIKQIISSNFTNIKLMDDFVNLVLPYKDALFTIPINSKFSFCKLNKLYANEIGYSYAKLCNIYFKCSYLLRLYSLDDNETALLDIQRSEKEQKLREFNKTFNKKRLRNCALNLDIS